MIRRSVQFAFENSLFLLAGALAGLIWANVGPASYSALRDTPILLIRQVARHGVSLHYLVNDVLMAFFFALAGKEVWEAMLPGGALRDVRRAATPIVCAAGGMAGPGAIYVLGAWLIGQLPIVGRGWAIPCATDIAFSYLIARLVFGRAHPATPFLLLLAIADDAFGLIILALFYPVSPVQPLWLLLPVSAVLAGLLMRRGGVRSFWWYLVFPGTVSWSGFALCGLHPALSLLPIIPVLPHARAGRPQVRWEESHKKDALDQFEAWWKKPVEFILGLFALLNAGVVITSFGEPTLLVLLGLLVGKPLGILLSGLAARHVLSLRLPPGVGTRELVALGCAAGIGFTVALFVTTVAFQPGVVQDQAKMGALGSCLAALTSVVAARVLRVRRTPPSAAHAALPE